MHKITAIKMAVLALMLLPALVLACAPRPEPAPVAASPPARGASSKPAWEQEWDRTLGAARKEGQVTIYETYGAEWRVAMNEVMEKKYGITVSTVTGKSMEIGERILREQRNKLYQADVIAVISSSAFLDIYQSAGVLQSFEPMLILPEVIDPKAWAGGKLNWFDPDTKTLLWFREMVSAPVLINTDMVKPQEMKVWDDLLSPKWKGKMILSDPAIGGAGKVVMTMLAYAIKDWNYIDRLVKQEPNVQRDYRLMAEWVSRARYPIAIGPGKGEVAQFKQAGAPIQLVNFEDGSITGSGSGSLAVPNGSPHPNAAKVFINFLLSKEGQNITARVGGYPSARVDVPTDFLDPEVVRRPGIKYFSTEDRGYLQKLDEITRRLAEVMKQLSK
ncbi:MAG: ABC transporter substrate-binding protein [Chloroflexi bacterium]|nr:ABC transporter substrate-binding protein [Chloroflexota bacterium]